ncbi:FkbM family methyltransferase [Maridesulfovibrio hydrothermalis]|uniref:Methyltransferase FkbM family n=1 Tax=Maridesulfovibrio hydrothermalis AM13 = DSM 14728 TaxID=1121451 RepID=L0R7N6_9BACT|nr:FkbM family methyltransferase [Maridesulfovibrio hydrothermalis]CCO22743.1 Methyltransferase FkbM family [Maridesulfovibrio hydrothermalis AM13 = DSM 14728]
MTRQEILNHLNENQDAWLTVPSVFKNEAGKPEFEMLLAKVEMRDPGSASLFFRETRTGGFEYASRAFIHAHLQPDDIFIDVGAHFGLYTLTAAMKFPDKVKVLAVEPHPANIKRLRMWTDFNNCSENIHFAQCAASDRSGFSLLNLNSSMGHSLVPVSKSNREPIKVAVEPIDKLAADVGIMDSDNRIILKIDTEGYELPTLKGALNLLKTGRVAAIIWEKGHFHGTPKGVKDFTGIISLLRDMGYESFRFPHEDMGGPLVPYSPNHELCNIISIDSSLKPLPVYDQPWKAHIVLPSSMRPAVSADFMIGYTKMLMQEKHTDCGRWSRWNSLGNEPDLRAGLAGQLVPEESTVLDAGAGLMLLRDYIPEGCTYIPLDIVARCRSCIVADLNQQQYPTQKYDVVAALFVFEFLHDPISFLKWAAKHSKKIIFTYHVTMPATERDKRRAAGFFNDYTLAGLKQMVEESGWKIKSIADITLGQVCFECIKKGL